MLGRPAILAAIITCNAANSADAGCKSNPHRHGACYRVHGTVMMSADVLWVLTVPSQPGAHFVIRPAPGNTHWLPATLRRFESEIPPKTLAGDFLVCPIPEQQTQFERGYLKFICVESGSDVSASLERR